MLSLGHHDSCENASISEIEFNANAAADRAAREIAWWRPGGPRGLRLLAALFCFLKNLSEVRMLTTFYLAKNDHQWVSFISLEGYLLASVY